MYNELPCLLILHRRSGPRFVSACINLSPSIKINNDVYIYIYKTVDFVRLFNLWEKAGRGGGTIWNPQIARIQGHNDNTRFHAEL